MKLYRSSQHTNRWFAFGENTGWVMFPAEINGWEKRQPARGFNPIHIHEIPLRMGFNTGIPGAPWAGEERPAIPDVPLREAA